MVTAAHSASSCRCVVVVGRRCGRARVPRCVAACCTALGSFAVVAMLLLFVYAAPAGDKNANCAHWADIGECENNPGFMMSDCSASCAKSSGDSAGKDVCEPLVKRGDCRRPVVALKQCRASCYRLLRKNLTDDTEGNCWYWATDGGEPRRT